MTLISEEGWNFLSLCMVKKCVAVFLIALMFIASTGNTFTYLLFKVNQSYIIENLCRNKDKQEMQCNGKCHLSEMIADNEEPEQRENPMPPATEERITVYFTEVVGNLTDDLRDLELARLDDMNENIRTNRHQPDIFHPPQS